MATNGSAKTGKVLQVIGPAVDVRFEENLPEIYTALRVSNPAINKEALNLTLEVAQHVGENTVRCVAMDSTDGLVRGMEVLNTAKPIQMPVGKEVLGRILNVVGQPVDEGGPVKTDKLYPIHRLAPSF
ncbi:MAG: F0F1 ATP synthase subunit beta, partial [Deltaproteobacteria bacterium]|nr:F0F1 ATP synthase subunit beta [Deltaproteobacteria bacterium]